MTSPAAVYVVGLALLARVSPGTWAGCARTVALSWFECVPSADDAVATFVTLPAVTLAGVIVYDAVQVIAAPTARLAVTGQLTLALSSATVNGPLSATFPLLVSR